MSSQTPEPNAQSEIDRLFAILQGIDPETKEYATVVDQITKLRKLVEIDDTFDLKKADQLLKVQESESANSLKEKELNANLHLKKLDAELKEKDVETYGKLKLETLAPIAGSLAGIVLILGFERAHVVTSKALGFVMKSR